MTGDDVTIRLTRDQALVLSDWLDVVVGTAELDALVSRDRAVWSPLHEIAGTLETTLPEVFAPDYGTLLEGARQRLLATLGELGRPAADS